MEQTFAPIVHFLDGLIHRSALGDFALARRHRLFIGAHLGVGLVALSALPLWFVLAGSPSVAVAFTFAWLACPIALAVLLSRTGRLQLATLASASVFTGTILWIAALAGGLSSPILAWLVVVPFAGALSGSPRMAGGSAAIAALGLLCLAALALSGILPGQPAAGIATLAADALPLFGAIACAGWLAIAIERLHRTRLQAMERGEEHYRLLADNATDLITRHSGDGDVEFVSPAARMLLGAPASDILGGGLCNRIHVADRPGYLLALSRAFNLGAPATVEFRVRRGGSAQAQPDDGRFILVEMRCRPVLGESGGVRAVVAVTHDISDQKARETDLRTAREAAERANLAKTSFIAHMSHELRTPLNAIIGFSEILDRSAAGTIDIDRQREYAKLIRASGEHLLEVVNGILDISKIESGMFDISVEPLSVAPLLESCSEMMAHHAAERGVTLVRTIGRDLPHIHADPRAVRQMVLNLLSNAIKFTERGGTVRLGARVDGTGLAVFVADNGIGISAADLPRLGTPFVQVDSSYDRRFEGTGLGLSVVKGLAALHGGSVAIESAIGAGTTVTVTLPVDQAVAGQKSDTGMLAEQHKELKRA